MNEDDLSDLVRDSKLETVVSSDHTTHIRYVSNQIMGQRRIRTEENWVRTAELGQGAFGIVWLEKCTSGPNVGQVRAVKEMKKGPVNNPATTFARELEAIAKFSQQRYRDCFVRSFGWYENPRAVFITMEYVELGDLDKHLTRPLHEPEAQAISSQLLEALIFMHDNKYVHRDLKPANILVIHAGPGWWVKISDFGISKRIDTTALRTRIGTEAYLAPEVKGIYSLDSQDGDEETFSAAVDIWAVGVIAFQMMTAKLPFVENRQLFNYVIRNTPFSFDPSTGPDLTNFIALTMAASPSARPTSRETLQLPWIRDRSPVLTNTATSNSASKGHLSKNLEPPVSPPSAAWNTTEWTTIINDQYTPPPTQPVTISSSEKPAAVSQPSAIWDTTAWTAPTPDQCTPSATQSVPTVSSTQLTTPPTIVVKPTIAAKPMRKSFTSALIKVISGVQQEIAEEAAASISTSGRWVTKHDFTSPTEYTAVLNDFVNKGYKLRWVSAYETMAKVPRVAAVFENTPSVPWIACHSMSAGEYQNKVNAHHSQGYRLELVNGYSLRGSCYYTAIWIWEQSKSPGGYVARHALTSSDYQAEFNKWWGQGYRLKHVSGYTVNNRALFAAIWEQSSDGIAWMTHHDMTSQVYQQTFDRYVAQGFRLKLVCGYILGNIDYYVAIWDKSPGGAWIARHGLTAGDFQKCVDEYTRDGFVLKVVSGYGLNPLRFAALWEKDS